jgi:TonB family protein
MEWHWMSGDDRVRYCRQCNLNVYNLSGMNRWEAEELILRAEGRLCVRFYRRPDGTLLTEDCPVGLRAVKKRLSRLRQHIIGATMSFLGLYSFFGTPKLLAENSYSPPVMGSVAWEPVAYAVVEQSESFIREKARFKVNPVYHASGRRRILGDAVVKLIITPDGRVTSAELVQGNPLFKEVSEEAARRWRFEPMIIDGTPTRVESTLTFHFK